MTSRGILAGAALAAIVLWTVAAARPLLVVPLVALEFTALVLFGMLSMVVRDACCRRARATM